MRVHSFRTAFGENAVALRIGVGAEAEEDFAGVVHVHVVIPTTRYLVSIIWPMSQRPCASRRQLHPQSAAARECLGSPIDAQLPGLRAISAAGASARELS